MEHIIQSMTVQLMSVNISEDDHKGLGSLAQCVDPTHYATRVGCMWSSSLKQIDSVFRLLVYTNGVAQSLSGLRVRQRAIRILVFRKPTVLHQYVVSGLMCCGCFHAYLGVT
jgi:hypothetical protein